MGHALNISLFGTATPHFTQYVQKGLSFAHFGCLQYLTLPHHLITPLRTRVEISPATKTTNITCSYHPSTLNSSTEIDVFQKW
jgi:hypothetical protein